MNNLLPPDPYVVLDVARDATATTIKTAYRRLALKYHPDKFTTPGAQQAASNEFYKIQTAYEILSDQDRRERYDAQVRLAGLRKESLERQAKAEPNKAKQTIARRSVPPEIFSEPLHKVTKRPEALERPHNHASKSLDSPGENLLARRLTNATPGLSPWRKNRLKPKPSHNVPVPEMSDNSSFAPKPPSSNNQPIKVPDAKQREGNVPEYYIMSQQNFVPQRASQVNDMPDHNTSLHESAYEANNLQTSAETSDSCTDHFVKHAPNFIDYEARIPTHDIKLSFWQRQMQHDQGFAPIAAQRMSRAYQPPKATLSPQMNTQYQKHQRKDDNRSTTARYGVFEVPLRLKDDVVQSEDKYLQPKSRNDQAQTASSDQHEKNASVSGSGVEYDDALELSEPFNNLKIVENARFADRTEFSPDHSILTSSESETYTSDECTEHLTPASTKNVSSNSSESDDSQFRLRDLREQPGLRSRSGTVRPSKPPVAFSQPMTDKDCNSLRQRIRNVLRSGHTRSSRSYPASTRCEPDDLTRSAVMTGHSPGYTSHAGSSQSRGNSFSGGTQSVDMPHQSRLSIPETPGSHVCRERRGKGDDGSRSEKRPPASKRRQLHVERLPCLFHVGEPTLYSNHTTTYAHVSQLLRHLISHGFYACQFCFQKFRGLIEKAEHRRHPCVKHCGKGRCLRKCPQSENRPQDYACIMSAQEQWRELYRLQYPHHGTPSLPGPLRQRAEGNHTADENNADTGGKGTSPDLPADQGFSGDSTLDPLNPPPETATGLKIVPETDAPRDTTSIETITHLQAQVKSLQGQIELQQAQISFSATDIEDLHMVIGNIWQALERANSSDSRHGSPLWKLVRRHAPRALHELASTTSVLPCTIDAGMPISTSSYMPSSDSMSVEWDWLNTSDSTAPSLTGPLQGLPSNSYLNSDLQFS